MQIQPQFHTVGNLLTGRLFKIPEYQRAYTWQTKQRADLFQDIEKVYVADADSHFMATIVGLRRKKIRIQSDEFFNIEIVDGQQRITTLTILLKALSKQLAKEDAERSKEINRLLVKGDDLSLLLLQTNHDVTHIFVDYLREGTKPAKTRTQTSADHNLVDAIVESEAYVKNWAAQGRDLVDLLALIKNRLTAIFFEIEDEALVYTVFEVLNSRGLDVTWFDKLKSMLMGIVFENIDAASRKDTVAELHRLWTEIYETIGLRWQSLNRETVTFAGTLRVSECPSRPLGEEASVEALTSLCGHKPRRVIDCTKWILRVTKAEAALLGNHRLRATTSIVQARLAAIAILLRNFPEREEKKILRAWESVTFRIYGLARRDSRNKRGDYVRLAWRISNENLSGGEIISELQEIGRDFPIKDVINELSNSNCYDRWTEELRYFFYRYEEYLAKEAGQVLNEAQWNRIWADEPSKSIEHIYPQSLGTDDPDAGGVFVHRLGNLMMLPPGLNSKLQDDLPGKKAAKYLSCGLLSSIEVGNAIKKRKWSKSAIVKREKRLIKWARSEWKD